MAMQRLYESALFYRPARHTPARAIDLTGKIVMPEYDDDRVPLDAHQRHIQQRVYSLILAEERIRARIVFEDITEDKLS